MSSLNESIKGDGVGSGGDEQKEWPLPEGTALRKNFTLMWFFNTVTKVVVLVGGSLFLALLKLSMLLIWTVFIFTIVAFGHNIYVLNRTPRVAVLSQDGLFLQLLSGEETIPYQDIINIEYNWLGFRHEIKVKGDREFFIYPERNATKEFLDELKTKLI